MMTSVDVATQLRESDFDEPAILIKITNVDSSVLSSRFGLYERVRREWAVSLDRVRNIRLALGVHDGKVVEVYRVAGWFHTGELMRRDGDIPPAEGRVGVRGQPCQRRAARALQGSSRHGPVLRAESDQVRWWGVG